MIRGTGIDSAVKLYLKGNGANGSTKFFDDSQSHKSITVGGNAQISTAQSKFGGSSMYFDGVSNNTKLDIDIDTIGTEDFVFGFWMYSTRSTLYYDTPIALSTNNTYDTAQIFLDLRANTSTVYFLSGGGGGVFSVTHAINTQYYVMIKKANNTIKLFFDGVEKASRADTYDYTGTKLNVGGLCFEGDVNAFPLEGYIDDFIMMVGAPVSSIDPTKVPTRQRG